MPLKGWMAVAPPLSPCHNTAQPEDPCQTETPLWLSQPHDCDPRNLSITSQPIHDTPITAVTKQILLFFLTGRKVPGATPALCPVPSPKRTLAMGVQVPEHRGMHLDPASLGKVPQPSLELALQKAWNTCKPTTGSRD